MPPDTSPEPVARRAGGHVLLTAASLVLGIAAVAFLEPTTTGGIVFVVAVCVLLVNAGGILVRSLGRRGRGGRAAAADPSGRSDAG